MPREDELTQWIASRTRPAPNLVAGIGDDCAIWRQPGSSEDLVFTTDLVLEGVHFRSTDPVHAAGAKALARALSDIAAMGAEPLFCLVSLAAPDDARVREFYEGLLSWDVPVAGGDLSRADHIMCDVVMCGGVPQGQSLRRDGAQAEDIIYVSAPLGAAAARDYSLPPLPSPRLSLGQSLRGRATACMDISDGLAIDLHRLCAASGCGATLAGVPLAIGASVEHALFGGEDYELLYTGPPGLPGVPIGRIIAGSAVTYQGQPLPARGWDHFAS